YLCPPLSSLVPYTTLFRSLIANHDSGDEILNGFDYINQKQRAALSGDIFNPTLSYVPIGKSGRSDVFSVDYGDWAPRVSAAWNRSEEHTSELQSRENLVCR